MTRTFTVEVTVTVEKWEGDASDGSQRWVVVSVDDLGELPTVGELVTEDDYRMSR